METRSLKTEADYDAALNEIVRFFEREPTPGSQDSERFNLLALMISNYEDRYWPVGSSDSVPTT